VFRSSLHQQLVGWSHSGGGACHDPGRLQKGPHASRVGRVYVVGGGVCLCEETDSEEEDSVPSRSTDTLETVVIRCGGGSWPEDALAFALLVAGMLMRKSEAEVEADSRCYEAEAERKL